MINIEKTKNIKTVITFCLFLGAIVFGLYFSILNFPFHNWDDGTYIYKNSRICKGLTWETVKWAFTTNYFGFYYPLTWLSHALDVSIFGLSPKGHYFHNILLHFLNCLLLFLFLLFALRDKLRGLIVALIFAVHTMNVETVAWLAERKNLLCTFFMLIAMIFYFFYQSKDIKRTSLKILYYILAVLFYSAGLMSKSSIVMFPFLLILLDIWPFERIDIKQKIKFAIIWNIFRDKIVFFAFSIFAGVATIFAQKELKAIISFATIPFFERIGEMSLSLWFYILKYFFPFNLAAFYEHHRGNYPLWEPVAIILFVASILFLFWLYLQKHVQLLVGFLFFLISLFPVLGLIQVGLQGRADRYVYFPYWGLSIVLVYGLIPDKFLKKKILVFSFILVLIFYFFPVSLRQIRVWESDRTLFENVIRVQPNSFLGYLKLGNYYYLDKKDYDKALNYYLKALFYKRDEPLIYCNIATLYCLKGEYDKGLPYCEQAIVLDQNYSEAYYRKGIILSKIGDYDNALESFKKAQRYGFDFEEVEKKLKERENSLKRSQK